MLSISAAVSEGRGCKTSDPGWKGNVGMFIASVEEDTGEPEAPGELTPSESERY